LFWPDSLFGRVDISDMSDMVVKKCPNVRLNEIG
jgi:hypothetical protein